MIEERMEQCEICGGWYDAYDDLYQCDMCGVYYCEGCEGWSDDRMVCIRCSGE